MAKTSTSRARTAYAPKRSGHKWYIYVLVSFTTLCLLMAAMVAAAIISGRSDMFPYLGSIFSKNAKDGSPSIRNMEDFNIIVAGLDNVGDVRRTDSIIIGHVSMKDKYANAIFMPRDSRVEIPGHGMDKINAAYAIGEVDLMRKTLENLLGTNIQYYFIIYVPGFVKLIDAVGGVEVCVEKRMKYTDRAQDLYIDLQAGCQHLDGTQAMGYARFRHDAEGDFGRIRRQQQVIRAIAKQALSKEMFKGIPKALGVLQQEKLVITNMSVTDFIMLHKLYSKDFMDNINMNMAPGVPQTLHGVSYVIPDLDELAYLTGSVFKQGYDPKNKQVKVEVLNGNRYGRAAETYARRLGYYGFDIVGTGNASDFDSDTTTVIERRDTPLADGIAKLLNAELQEQPDENAVADITVVIGRDRSR